MCTTRILTALRWAANAVTGAALAVLFSLFGAGMANAREQHAPQKGPGDHSQEDPTGGKPEGRNSGNQASTPDDDRRRRPSPESDAEREGVKLYRSESRAEARPRSNVRVSTPSRQAPKSDKGRGTSGDDQDGKKGDRERGKKDNGGKKEGKKKDDDKKDDKKDDRKDDRKDREKDEDRDRDDDRDEDHDRNEDRERDRGDDRDRDRDRDQDDDNDRNRNDDRRDNGNDDRERDNEDDEKDDDKPSDRSRGSRVEPSRISSLPSSYVTPASYQRPVSTPPGPEPDDQADPPSWREVSSACGGAVVPESGGAGWESKKCLDARAANPQAGSEAFHEFMDTADELPRVGAAYDILDALQYAAEGELGKAGEQITEGIEHLGGGRRGGAQGRPNGPAVPLVELPIPGGSSAAETAPEGTGSMWATVEGEIPNRDGINADARRIHILDGDGNGGGGGHAPGTGLPNKMEFPEDWDDDRIMDAVEDVARNPDEPPVLQDNDRWVTRGTRDGVDIKVIVNKDGTIWTAHPEGGEGVIVNDEHGNPRK